MMDLTKFVWRLHGGWKGYGRALADDWAVWLILGVLIWEDVMSWGVGIFVGVILLNYALTRMHLKWYRGALTQTQAWLDQSIQYMKADQQQKWKSMIEKEKATPSEDFN